MGSAAFATEIDCLVRFLTVRRGRSAGRAAGEGGSRYACRTARGRIGRGSLAAARCRDAAGTSADGHTSRVERHVARPGWSLLSISGGLAQRRELRRLCELLQRPLLEL